ncbi:hypothetical protein V6N13_109337 [Hibiscus sabdariffa]|uniref:Strictosidine synthase conserved region domain-containing protein n=1 Tax=Hibiscus sabdariffa TaxID=183260 RepID=A0ABR2FP95_9ROSI
MKINIKFLLLKNGNNPHLHENQNHNSSHSLDFHSIFLLCFLSTVVASAISFTKLQLPRNAAGPEAMAFELRTGHFFTGVADGRILKYQGPSTGFVDFGFAAPNRSKPMCDGTDILKPNPGCGRPLGMALLAPSDEKIVRFTDSEFWVLKVVFQFQTAVSVNDSTGRLLKCDVENKQVTPDNIKRTRLDDFWLAAAKTDQRTEPSLLPLGLRINGNVLQTVLNLERWYGNKSVSEVEEFGSKLYIASRLVDFIGVIKYKKSKILHKAERYEKI